MHYNFDDISYNKLKKLKHKYNIIDDNNIEDMMRLITKDELDFIIEREFPYVIKIQEFSLDDMLEILGKSFFYYGKVYLTAKWCWNNGNFYFKKENDMITAKMKVQ